MAVDASDPNATCSLNPYPETGKHVQFGTAFAFSLETATTVGYGLPVTASMYFEPECDVIRTVIYFQMVMSMMYQAFLFAFFFARLGRAENRGNQVVFSNKAVLRRRKGDGRWVFEFRVYDTDPAHPIVEAHVRLVAIRHPRTNNKDGTPSSVKTEPLRLWKPNDELGGMILTSVPTVVSHHIDIHSSLSPRRTGAYYEDVGRVCVQGVERGSQNQFLCEPADGVCPDFSLGSCGMNLRELDSATGNRNGLQCRLCGETYYTRNNLAQHIIFQSFSEKHGGIPVEGSHQELDVDAVLHFCSKGKDREISLDEIKAHIAGEVEPHESIEILALMEGIEPLLSGTFQSMQSYTIDDIEFESEFVDCLVVDKLSSSYAAKMDLNLFHKVRKIGEEKNPSEQNDSA